MRTENGLRAGLIKLHIRQIIVVKVFQNALSRKVILRFDKCIDGFGHPANQKILIQRIHRHFMDGSLQRRSRLICLPDRVEERLIAVQQKFIESHGIQRHLIDFAHRKQERLIFAPPFARNALNPDPHHGTGRDNRIIPVILTEVFQRSDNRRTFLYFIKYQKRLFGNRPPFGERNKCEDFLRIQMPGAIIRDFLLKPKVDIDGVARKKRFANSSRIR